ncbi:MULTISPECIES: Coenzyme F420 hydrogenase/dehydrogenase, beta subunit C-terminal domain [Butyrivibrio]|uniref:Coenzyme F420 hydrogenase/dehydrogenase, beta subunit C-terminal domain n=1 Tax=Butyrivibrio TaxID=830 RepID=UPI000422D32F|nr:MULTISPECIES: Coenzyme F420 hydrogenase/dehydrogenase, beta subunit C-terminal domain [Butyrivibrio]SEQ25367.1 Coenzyme F420 hydrogenase/dehydrogenase, beta subunit N-term [Butyrivibrio sp. TB]
MNIICDIEDCTGCSACESICPRNCIVLKENEEGFKYPYIDDKKCINCGLCKKTCPIINPPSIEMNKRKALIVRSKNSNILAECASGGAVTTFAEYILNKFGVVYSAVYDDDLNVCHIRIDKKEDLKRISGSKYVQSDITGVFKNVKQDVKDGKIVMFCGTPCQAAGLSNFLGDFRSNVIIVDLVCHGVPSPLLWRKYLEYCNGKKHKIIKANFRSKHFGYHMASMECKFDDGIKIFASARTNMMLKCFFKNVADRYSCYNCKFKTIDRCSDLTVYDCWHAEELSSEIVDDDKGYTNVILQSEKGVQLLKNCSELLEIYDTSLDEAINVDGSMATNSVKMPETRKDFYKKINEMGLENTVFEYFPISFLDYCIEMIKEILVKLKLSSMINKLFKKFKK